MGKETITSMVEATGEFDELHNDQVHGKPNSLLKSVKDCNTNTSESADTLIKEFEFVGNDYDELGDAPEPFLLVYSA